jgi:hypothetical protein
MSQSSDDARRLMKEGAVLGVADVEITDREELHVGALRRL